MSENNTKELTKEIKVVLLKILKKGFITESDKKELTAFLDIHSIPIVLADGRTYEDLKRELRDGL